MDASTLTDRRNTRRRPVRAHICLLAVAMLTATTACTDQAPDPAPTTEPTSPTASSSPTVATSEPTADTTEQPDQPDQDPADEVRDLWEQAHRRRVTATHDTTADTVDFDDLADDPTADTLESLVAAGTSDLDGQQVDIQLGTDVTVDVATVDIRGCVLVAASPTSDHDPPTLTTTRWDGQARRLPQGWRLTDVRLAVGECVPAALAASAVDAYREWLDATNGWWDPPNPDDPRIDQLMGEPALTAMRDILAEHAQLGIAVRDTHEPDSAVVTDVQGQVVTVSDCYPAADGDAAAVDLESRERREDLTPSPRPDQLDAVIVELQSQAPGSWVVVGWSTLVDVECTPRETAHVVIP